MPAAVLAATSTSGGGGGIGFLVFAVLIIGGLFVLINRGNRKRQAYARQVQSAAEVGSEVMTSSGIYGTVVDADEETFLISIAPGVEVRFAKGAVARVLAPEGLDTPNGDELDDGLDGGPTDGDGHPGA